MKNDWITPDLQNLFQTMSDLESSDDLGCFMRDVASLKELNEMAKRWKAAQMIEEGLSYRAISEKTGLSTATVTRVAYWLKNGEGGYQLALKNFKK